MVSIIVPSKEKNLWNCLTSLRDQTYKDKEVIVIENEFTPVALNRGIKQSQGDIVIRCDAHAYYPSDYVEKCVNWLNKTGADNVGGNCISIPSTNTLIANLIVKVMMFGGLFRWGSSKITETDTVWGGCYRREIFDKIGMFDERLKRCQDIEFNMRLKRAGGKILLIPDIRAYYYPKSTLKELIIHSFIDGLWTTKILKYGIILKLRHYFPLFFLLGLLVMVWALL